MSRENAIHFATYLVPSISIEFFESLLQFLEKRLNRNTTLRYESRFEGPQADRGDIFIGSHAVDVAFMNASGYLKMRAKGDANFELLPLSLENVSQKGDYGASASLDIVVNKNMQNMSSLHDLKGCRWAQNTCDRLTSAITLYQLKSIGVSASFFSNVLKSRSHLDSIRMILQRKAHASAIDSMALQMFLRENPNEKSELFTIMSWGPFPPYAIAVRKTLDPEVRRDLVKVLSTMHETSMGKEILSSFKVKRFSAITEEDLETGEDYFEATKGLSFDAVYY